MAFLQAFIGPAILAASAGIAASSLPQLIENNQRLSKQIDPAYEVLYLPKTEAVRMLSFGYHNAASNLFWFKTISYFGKHYATDRNFAYLNHLCQLVTTLNPRAAHAFQFCANMLSWEANRPADSIALLTKAIQGDPQNWLYLYLRGFTHLFFLKDSKGAKLDFTEASKLPGAPATVKRLAAKQIAELDDPHEAEAFLESMIANERDPSAKKVLILRLEEIRNRAKA